MSTSVIFRKKDPEQSKVKKKGTPCKAHKLDQVPKFIVSSYLTTIEKFIAALTVIGLECGEQHSKTTPKINPSHQLPTSQKTITLEGFSL